MTDKLRYAEFRAPFGSLFAAATEKGICSISLGDLSGSVFVKQLRDRLGQEPVEDRAHFKGLLEDLERYFSGERVEFSQPVDFCRATDFQKRVWLETRKIPYGETRTYKQIAELVGKPRAYRAVGQALGSNPVPIIVPCHRVIGRNGSLTGFGSGLKTKEWLLRLEGVH